MKIDFVQITSDNDDLFGLTSAGDVYRRAYRRLERDFDSEKDKEFDKNKNGKISYTVFGWEKLNMDVLD
jgi:hypothetical protein